MKKFYKFLILTLSFTNLVAAEKTIKIKSDPWCPFACDTTNPNRPGVVVEVAKAIFEKEGYKVDYQVMNYARAITETRAGLNDAVAGCAKEDAPDFIFPTKSVAKTVYKYLSLKDSKMNVKNLDSLKGIKVGSINGYTYDQISTEAIANKHPSFMVISGEDGMSQIFKMLKNKRIDAIVESEDVLLNYIAENKLDKNEFKFVGMMKQAPQDISLCFSPKNKESKILATKLVKGMDDLKKSGELKKILEKYSMSVK